MCLILNLTTVFDVYFSSVPASRSDCNQTLTSYLKLNRWVSMAGGGGVYNNNNADLKKRII